MIQVVKDAIELLGNANAHPSHLRRERVINNLNKSLPPIVGTIKILSMQHPCYSAQSLPRKARRR